MQIDDRCLAYGTSSSDSYKEEEGEGEEEEEEEEDEDEEEDQEENIIEEDLPLPATHSVKCVV